MKAFSQALSEELQETLAALKAEHTQLIAQCEHCMHAVASAIDKLRSILRRHRFRKKEDEIHFFKVIKPHFLSQLIYYSKIYQIESRKPVGGDEILRQYFRTELQQLRIFSDKHIDLYKYYRTNNTHLDHIYFVRGKGDIKLFAEVLTLQFDPKFCTSHDHIIARIVANDLIELFLKDKLLQLDGRQTTPAPPANLGLKWTDSKAALTELIYALYSKGCLNHGNADIKTITRSLESAFDVNAGDIYRSFIEIKNRSNPSRFISGLKQALEDKIKEDAL